MWLFWSHCGRRGLRASELKRSDEGRQGLARADPAPRGLPRPQEGRVEFSSVGRPGPEASPGPKTDSKIRENGKPYIQREFEIESDQVFNNPA